LNNEQERKEYRTRNKEQGTRNKEQGTRNKEQGTKIISSCIIQECNINMMVEFTLRLLCALCALCGGLPAFTAKTAKYAKKTQRVRLYNIHGGKQILMTYAGCLIKGSTDICVKIVRLYMIVKRFIFDTKGRSLLN